jgi:hypothetical protein
MESSNGINLKYEKQYSIHWSKSGPISMQVAKNVTGAESLNDLHVYHHSKAIT